MSALPFDQPYYLEINHARWAAARGIIERLTGPTDRPLRSCLDVACGPGWFSERLVELGLDVVGIDGRAELVAEAAHRVRGASFRRVDVESQSAMSALGAFDLVFCFGLLYHVENPHLVIRNLARITAQALLLETMVYPSDEATLRLVTEGNHLDQGLTYRAIVASKPALVNMLTAAGFSWVAQFQGQIDHPDFMDNETQHARRMVLLAARSPLNAPQFAAVTATHSPMFDVARTTDRDEALRRAELELVEKEQVIRDLVEVANERLALIEQLDAAAAELRAALARAHDDTCTIAGQHLPTERLP